jgi:hypothetical protein
MTLGGKRQRSRARLACWVGAALVLGGCGGGGSSKFSSSSSAVARPSAAKRAAAYRSNAKSVCETMRDRLRHLGPAPAAGSGAQAARMPKAARYYRSQDAAVSTAIAHLKTLRPPSGEAPGARRLVREMRRTDVLERNEYRSALRGFRPGFLRASMALRPALSAERKAAGAAHLQACALEPSR